MSFKPLPDGGQYYLTVQVFFLILIIQTVYIVSFVVKNNTIKNYIDQIQINNRSISIYNKINVYNYVFLTYLLSYETY